jgi:predicted lipoprotein with Yx(FWY)xxD motif
MRPWFGAAVASLALWGCAGADGVAVPVRAEGGILVDTNGRTVYTFDRDRSGRSACSGACAAAWPPIEAASGAKPVGRFTVITRDDGTRQWTYDGKPLYLRTDDAGPGDRGGDGADNLWRVARP